jgi:hypothetical protein
MPLSYSHIASVTSGAWPSMTEIEGPSKGANGQPFEASSKPERPPARRLRLSSIVLGAVVGTLVAGLIAVVLLIILVRDSTPLLTQAEFDAAESRWEQHGPKSYNLDVVIGGKRAGKVHVEVRNGEVTQMLRDGVQPKQKRTWGVWTVPGQFDMIGLELESAQDPVAGFQAPAGSQVIQRAVFDRQYGYPRRYLRDVLGTDIEVSWETIHFQAVE